MTPLSLFGASVSIAAFAFVLYMLAAREEDRS
jgi:hypothetical protein